MVTEDEKRYIEEWHRDLAEHDRAQRIADAEDRGMQIGMQKGMQKGLQKGYADAVKNLMKNAGVTMEQAFDMLGIEADDRKQIEEKLHILQQ